MAECPDEEELHIIRHSAAHIMAQAIKRLYPDADFAYGPATENGFYYDVDLGDKKLTEEDFPVIEAEMKRICKENLKFSVFELPRQQAVALMQERKEKYKVEHIGDLPEDARITFYQQGDYIDMCVGPHICYTKALKAFKLTAVSGAYWKGDKDNKMLTRVNGIAFKTKEELDEHLKMLEEAKKRDHRKIGREMDLFMMRDEAPGFPFFLPNGMAAQKRAHRLLARDPRQGRLRGNPNAAYHDQAAVGNLGPLGPLQRQHVLHHHRRRAVLREAHELPRRRFGVRIQAA